MGTRSVFHLLRTPPYLSLAERAIFCDVTVCIIHRNTDRSAWLLFYQDLDNGHVVCNNVIFMASNTIYYFGSMHG